MKVLIADAGSTKTEWVILEDGKVVERRITKGYNPNYAPFKAFLDILYKELEDLPAVDAVYYYGSGCGNETVRQDMTQYLKVRFEEASEVFVTHDLMGACHALFGKEKGIACILGTGANSCLYDGNDITDRAVSLGYLVGDEGSGCYIGRKLVRDYFYHLMPLELKLQFDETYHLNIKDFIDKVYHQPEASKYLAGFTLFAGKHQDHPFIKELVKDCFNDFIKAFLLPFNGCHELPIGFVGSVAYHFQDLLKETLADNNLRIGSILFSPVEGLLSYHHVLFNAIRFR